MAEDTPAPKKKVAKKKAAAKKVASKSVKKKVARKKVAATKTLSPVKSSAPAAAGRRVITPQERLELIGKAAYLISRKRQPHEGCMESDWVAAETVIDMLFEVK